MDTVNRSTGRRTAARGDVTAMQQAALEEKRDADAAEAARLRAVQTEEDERARREDVVDYTDADVALPEVVREEDSTNPYREIIIKYAIERMAFGREIRKPPVYDENGHMTEPPVLGNIRFFDFEEGRRYRVPRALADHLDERGYVYH